MLQIKIIKEPTNLTPFLVISKPQNLPSAPICENDTNNALSMAINLYPEIKNVKGKKSIEYGLLHRIDTATKGLLLIATTQEFYDYLQNEQKENRFIKYYKATCLISKLKIEGFEDSPINDISKTPFEIESYFRYYGVGRKSVRPVSKNSSKIILKKIENNKIYKTEIKILSKNENTACVLCSITQGFKHQVRAHLAWCGLPIKGDKTYNPKSDDDKFDFNAFGFEFYYKNERFYFEDK